MKCHALWTITLPVFLIGSYSVGDDKGSEPPTDPYAELFSVPSKVTLDDKQKEKLAELRKEYEPQIVKLKANLNSPKLDNFSVGFFSQAVKKLERAVVRKKNLLLTDEQRSALGIKLVVPSFAQEKALSDEKIWDISQLEKVFTIESRSFDPEEHVISFVVITKTKWTDKEKERDGLNWQIAELGKEPPVQVIFYNKNDEKIFALTGRYTIGLPRGGSAWVEGGLTRLPVKLTDKQAEEGLQRFRIKIDLDMDAARDKEAASVKVICPELK
jgi:hypothetical protein